MISTILITDQDCIKHDTGEFHPESPERLKVLIELFNSDPFSQLHKTQAPYGTEEQILLIHDSAYLESIKNHMPSSGFYALDADTIVSPCSFKAALKAVGAVCEAVDYVMDLMAKNVFCAVRPPGHHAEPGQAMGFCLFNNIAIGAAYALSNYNLNKVAIIDFDVHHGNGTEKAFIENEQVFYASTHQYPFYPGTGKDSINKHIINIPLESDSGSKEFRDIYRKEIFPALKNFKPDFIFLSAGFDAHKDDQLAQINLDEADYEWITNEIMNIADHFCHGRLVSALEGGYNLEALKQSVALHVQCLMRK